MSTTWKDVPDPRDDASPCTAPCQVVFEVERLRHIVEKHVADPRELWDEWAGPALAGRLRAAWQLGSAEEERQLALEQLSPLTEAEAKSCLRVPLAVLYDNYEAPAVAGGPSRPRETWALILPCGALLIVRSRPDGGAVWSCYFKGAVCRATTAHHRWRALAEELVLCFADARPDGKMVPPPEAKFVLAGAEMRSRVRFRTPATWHLEGREARPWFTMPNPWPAPAPVAPARRLGPRRHY